MAAGASALTQKKQSELFTRHWQSKQNRLSLQVLLQAKVERTFVKRHLSVHKFRKFDNCAPFFLGLSLIYDFEVFGCHSSWSLGKQFPFDLLCKGSSADGLCTLGGDVARSVRKLRNPSLLEF